MAQVVDMMRSYRDPSGNFPSDQTIKIALIMRRILLEDLAQCDMALSVQSFNGAVGSDDMLGAWWLLRSDERSAWKRLLEYVNPNYSLENSHVN